MTIFSGAFTGPELFRYRAVMARTLAPLRRKMAESKLFAGLYHRLKKEVYGGLRKVCGRQGRYTKARNGIGRRAFAGWKDLYEEKKQIQAH